MQQEMARLDRSILNDKGRLTEEYETKGRNIRDIAADIGCSYSTVGRALARLNIEARGVPQVIRDRQQARKQVSEKKCSRCKKVKPRSEFSGSRTDATGLQCWCKECQTVGCKEYRTRHPDRVRAINARTVKRLGREYYRAKHQALKRQMVDAYGGRCECCDETEIEFLSLDHVNGGGHQHRKAVGSSRVWRDLRDAGWPKEGWRVLCMNCQFGFRFGRECPHQLTKESAVAAPTREFLEELRDRARRYGWDGDYVEVRSFVGHLYREAGLPVPDLEPYPEEGPTAGPLAAAPAAV